MTTYKQGDIVLIPFPFTDLSRAKKRPALVVSADWYNTSRQDFVLVAITSVIPEKPTRDELLLPEHEAKQAGLLFESMVKTGKVFTMQQSLAVRALGELPEKTVNSILNRLVGVFKER